MGDRTRHEIYMERLKSENEALKAENKELNYILNDIQAVNNVMRMDIEKAVVAECGCVVIEGSRTSTAYQDFVSILLANDYAVELMPIDGHRKLKITIKESEEK